MELIEEITNATDNKKHAIGVFIDLKKAFDTVDHGKFRRGSILGPAPFILYINDICNVSYLVKCILFADDTNVFCA